jgi:hypothetical protein
MKAHLLLASIVATSAWAQNPGVQPPQFKDYPVTEVFQGKPVLPILETPDERRFEAVIGDGVSKGWGVFDGATGKEFPRPGPNFAGHYILVNFGCGESPGDCLSLAAILRRTGDLARTAPARFVSQFPLKSPLAYRLDSRLLITDTCEEVVVTLGPYDLIGPESEGCGAHYYLMDDDGLTLIHRIVWDPPLKPTSRDVVVNSR